MDEVSGKTKQLAPLKEFFNLSSPIGVIGACTALVDSELIAAVIFAEGNLRWGALTLAAVFFILTVAPFWVVLWHRNYVLYPPREYDQVDASAYVEAMHRGRGVPTHGRLPVLGEDQLRALEASFINALKEEISDLVSALVEKVDKANLKVNEQISVKTMEEIVDRSLHTAAKNATDRFKGEQFVEIASPITVQGNTSFMVDYVPDGRIDYCRPTDQLCD